MSNKIQRINIYEDDRFDKDILRQHGAFIVDGKYKCSFKIINKDSAIVFFDKEIDVYGLIDEFRFYSEHIINFYDENMKLIKFFPPKEIFHISIKDIQPSQFFVDMDKVKAVETFIESEEDICIPLAKIKDYFISQDGHTRLYYAITKGYSKVRAYFTDPGDYLEEFAEEARKRKVYSPHDLKLVSHEEYKIKWHKFCDDFFRQRINMDKYYCFNQEEIENIVNRFGKDFYEKVLRDIKTYADKWKLTSLQFIPSYSANLVFKCSSESLGSVILKIGNPSSREIITEFNTLREYNGRGFCKIFDSDIESGIILEECIRPGNTLNDESSLNKRLSVFSSLFKGLHITPINAEVYPTYIEWVCRITEYMSKRQDCKELYLYMKKARDICLSVSNLYSQKMLLHGDFHHNNILLGADGEYKIIDPKGVIGDPVFDVPRFILNEFSDEITTKLYKKINDIICILEEELNIPSCILKQCLYVETAMGMCWCVEDGSGPEEYERLIKVVAFVETILNT